MVKLPELKLVKGRITLHIVKLSSGYNLVDVEKNQVFAIPDIKNLDTVVATLADGILQSVTKNFDRTDKKAPSSITINIEMGATRSAHLKVERYTDRFIPLNDFDDSRETVIYDEDDKEKKHLNRDPVEDEQTNLVDVDIEDVKSEVVELGKD